MSEITFPDLVLSAMVADVVPEYSETYQPPGQGEFFPSGSPGGVMNGPSSREGAISFRIGAIIASWIVPALALASLATSAFSADSPTCKADCIAANDACQRHAQQVVQNEAHPIIRTVPPGPLIDQVATAPSSNSFRPPVANRGPSTEVDAIQSDKMEWYADCARKLNSCQAACARSAGEVPGESFVRNARRNPGCNKNDLTKAACDAQNPP